jgi:hypothetical protein
VQFCTLCDRRAGKPDSIGIGLDRSRAGIKQRPVHLIAANPFAGFLCRNKRNRCTYRSELGVAHLQILQAAWGMGAVQRSVVGRLAVDLVRTDDVENN